MARELTLFLSEDGADAERVATLTSHLRRELVQLDLATVAPVQGAPAPEGTRAFEVAAVGGLLVALGDSTRALRQVVEVIRNWLARSPGPVRTIRLEIAGDVLELSHASQAEEERLVELFVRRHGTSGSTG